MADPLRMWRSKNWTGGGGSRQRSTLSTKLIFERYSRYSNETWHGERMSKLVGLVMLIASHVAAPPSNAEECSAPPVVFVCERGSAKSMIAALWFNRLASERGLRLQGVSRGVNPEAKIPDGVARNLLSDGFDLTGLVPTRLQSGDLTQAVRVVAIGAKSPLFDALARAPERWDDIPPTSVDYGASRDALRHRLSTLVDSLMRAQSPEQRR
jgi:arsenate reductase (thioredoxin)